MLSPSRYATSLVSGSSNSDEVLGWWIRRVPCSPANVIEGDGHHLAGPQSVGRNQQEHRVIAQSHCRGSVYGSQKCANRLPREGAWQLLETVKARRIDLAGQSCGNPAVNRQESKERPQRSRCRAAGLARLKRCPVLVM